MNEYESLRRCFVALGIRNGPSFTRSLPFAENDVTAGSESELQAVVVGAKSSVDLPLTIEASNYYANIQRRVASGDAPKRAITDLERWLNDNRESVWENSWVRVPLRALSRFAQTVWQSDLRASKRNPALGTRADAACFYVPDSHESVIRVPLSYLLKLALADFSGAHEHPAIIRTTGLQLMEHFLSDNSSPESFSFHIIPLRREHGLGLAVARETLKRFLLSQLLVMYANRRFGLAESGQRALVYYAPHPPVRLRQLNDAISDAFYRELLMSPCLAGWDEGEAKHAYMNLCHQVLSRSQLNAVAKLKEAGIIINNLIVLPNTSNISLANNGVHVSLGSRLLTRARREQWPGFGAAEEKMIGDLTIKFVEHFLPLFVGTYSAAPYRFDFAEFHPERVLGFLPHELDYTHLRMLWRRWKKKAHLNVFSFALTPFGPPWLDRALSSLFQLKGDYLPDGRLIDYFNSLLSTDRSAALDGTLGNGERLKRDLADMGVFDPRMSLYLLYRLREFAVMGYAGFEGRHYSLFESLTGDMARAVDLQTLVTALAFKYQAGGRLAHSDIPDDPFIESERRQIIFGAAIGLPTFFVRRTTTNRFLHEILKHTTRTRASRRYPGYVRVHHDDYRRALLQLLRTEAAELIEMFGLRETLEDLQARLDAPDEHSAFGKLTRGILDGAHRHEPLQMTATTFNLEAENYYRNRLRRQHLSEALEQLHADLHTLTTVERHGDERLSAALQHCLPDPHAGEFVKRVQSTVLNDELDETELIKLIQLTLLSLHHDMQQAERMLDETQLACPAATDVTPIH